jgi:Protein of unknown function (DUF4019)
MGIVRTVPYDLGTQTEVGGMTMTSASKNSNARRLGFAAFVTLALVSLCSCGSATKDLSAAKQAVGEFHSQLDAGDYAALYQAADPKLRTITTETDFTKLLAAIHRKLGTVRSADMRTYAAAWFAGQGTTVTLTYNTTFSAGSGTEQFIWHISDGRAMLYGYHINSADLIEK